MLIHSYLSNGTECSRLFAETEDNEIFLRPVKLKKPEK